jgi:hypothetical protein
MAHSREGAAGRPPLRLSPLVGEAPPDPWGARLLIFLGYLALGVVFTWPLALHLGDGVIQKGGLPVDAGQGVWNLWWARTALLRGQNPFTTAYLFYPLQIDLFFQTLSLPNAIMVAPVLLAVGPVAAFNTVALLSFGLGGYFAYCIARALVNDRTAALLAGFVFAFAPYHIQRLWSGPMELIAVHWLPLYVLLLMRALARPSLARLLAAALALLVTTLASQYYGLYAVVYTAGHGLLAAAMAPRGARLRTLGTAAAVGALWAAGLLPMIWAVGGVGDAVLEDWYVRQVYHSVSLVDLVAPNIQHPLWGVAAAAWLGGLHPFGLETGAGLGLTVTILCLLALARRPRRAWPWAALALGTIMLAMGPQLRLAEADSPVPGPFLLLDIIGPFRNSSRPSVFLALTMIPVAALVAEGFASLRGMAPGGRWQAAGGRGALASWGVAALLAAELIVAPWPITRIAASPAYRMLNADPQPGAVIELPPRNNDSVYLLDQICHGRPLVGGYLARLPDYPLASYPSALKGLWDAAPPAPDMLDLDPAAELATLGIRFVTLDLTQLPRTHAARLRARLDVAGVGRAYADERLEVYAVDPGAARPVAVLGPGWYDTEGDGSRRWRWMQGRAGLSLIAPAEGAVELRLTATAYGAGRPLRIWRGDELLASIDIPAAPRDQVVTLTLLLPPGSTDLALESPAAKSPEGRSLSLSVEGLAVTRLPLAAGYTTRPAPPPTIPAIGAPPCGS